MRRVTATEAGRQFSELINQVRYKGESFIVTRNGEDIVRISPVVGGQVSLRELLEWIEASAVDERFADDLEDIQREQRPPEDHSWDS